ncbi:MAG: hypothetical protein QF570_16075 [Myxococcota bacterium]|jgi:hypothetical protein|nr:hypothetical protein [Myxococcota bacterium]
MKEFGADRKAMEEPTGPQSRPTIALVATLVIGFALGLITGRFTAPTPDATSTAPGVARTDTGKPAEKEDDGPGIGMIAGLAKQAGEFIESSDEGQGLAAVGDILSHASVTDILDWSRNPEEVSGRIINEMSDDELVSTITSITKVSPEQIGEYSDLRDYANRLSHIAMSGMITDDISDEFVDVHLTVEFATDASSSRGAEDPSSVFPEKTRKIYAVIENPGDIGGNVMVHWYQVDQPRKLLLDQYRISPKDNYSYVWLKAPNRRWQEGQYRVEFFSADEFLAPLASGTYRVVAE